MKVEVETVQAELTLFGAENAVFTDPASVLYLSGYNDPADVGFPYVGLPAAVVVGACDSVLLVPSVCKSAAEGTGVALILYEVTTIVATLISSGRSLLGLCRHSISREQWRVVSDTNRSAGPRQSPLSGATSWT
jgi:hypothetical protein